MIICFLWYGWISSRPIDVPTSVQSNRVIDLMPARTMFLAISAPSPLSPISRTLAARSLQWARSRNLVIRLLVKLYEEENNNMLLSYNTKILLLEFKISMSSSKLVFFFLKIIQLSENIQIDVMGNVHSDFVTNNVDWNM